MAGTIYGLPSDGRRSPHLEEVLSGQGSLSDFANSWWCQPRALYDPLRDCAYMGGVSREGTVQVAKFDLRRRSVERVTLGTYEKDDHNVPAFLVPDDKPPMVAVVRHAVESVVRLKVGTVPHAIGTLNSGLGLDVPFPGPCTYAHLIRRPGTDTVALITRSGTDGWYVAVSTDWGATWGTARRFHGKGYGTFRMVGDVVKYAVTGHPTTTPNNSIHRFDIDAASGDVSNAHDGTVFSNLWTGTTVLPSSSMTIVAQLYDPEAVRVFDVAADGSVAAMLFDKTVPELGGTYGVFRTKAGGMWDWEPLVHSGVPVGYYPSSYVGGASFGSTGDSVWLAREDVGTWTLEHWAKAGGAWSMTEEVHSTTEGKLGRPQVPWGAEGSGLLAALDYWRYPSDTFQDYYADQVVRRTGVAD